MGLPLLILRDKNYALSDSLRLSKAWLRRNVRSSFCQTWLLLWLVHCGSLAAATGSGCCWRCRGEGPWFTTCARFSKISNTHGWNIHLPSRSDPDWQLLGIEEVHSAKSDGKTQHQSQNYKSSQPCMTTESWDLVDYASFMCMVAMH